MNWVMQLVGHELSGIKPDPRQSTEVRCGSGFTPDSESPWEGRPPCRPLGVSHYSHSRAADQTELVPPLVTP